MREKLKVHDGDTPGKTFEVKLEYPKKETAMSDMKCPFCQQELVEIQFGEQRYWSCINDRCNESVGFGGNLKLWQELIRTRKALDVANNAIDEILYLDSGKFIQEPAEMWKIAKSAKDKITVLEQKE